MRFDDRREAGRRLAPLVVELALDDPVVLALPRGGVPVGFEVARALGAALDVLVARKLGAPHQPELGIGAIAEGGARVIDQDLVRVLRLSDADVERVSDAEALELDRRVRSYRGGRNLVDLADRHVVIVDDGVATGGTAEAALLAVRQQSPARLVLAVPTCAREAAVRLRDVADVVISVITPHDLSAVGQWYRDFSQTGDAEVERLLAKARSGR